MQVNKMANTAQTMIQTEKGLINVIPYTQLGTAKSVISRSEHPSKYSIVMGDHPYFWVVTNREASILKKMGYEIVD
jgi:hypothetical protein